MRKSFVAANWKMYKGPKATEEFLSAFKKVSNENMQVGITVPFVDLTTAKNFISKHGVNLLLGAQNVYFEKEGAFTGEVSIPMLEEIGVDYVVIGHSERRNIFGESDELINKKLSALSKSTLRTILCVGESLAERESGKEKEVVGAQLRKNLDGIDSCYVKELTIAYEPIWAIGTGKTASAKDAQEMCAFIRKCIEKLYDDATAQAVRIQYGGSVKAENAKEILDMQDIDGALVGGASLNADEFEKIYNF